MNANLRVTPEKLRAKSQQFSTCDKTVQSLTRQMLDIVNQLRSTWQGEGATGYYNKLNSMNNDMQKLHRMIQEHTTDLNDIANTYQQGEQKAVQTAAALKTSGIA